MKRYLVQIDYPQEVTFQTTQDFKRSLKARTEFLHQQLKRKKIPSPCHDYGDYVVEKVIKNANGEFWLVGS